MKKLLASFLAMAMLLQMTAQEVVKDRQYYLEKSKKQRTAAWMLAGLGGAMMVGGAIAFSNNFEILGYDGGGETEGFIMLLGVPVALSSIPFFISAARNKGRAEMMAGAAVQPIRITDKYIVPSAGVMVRILLK